jgi:glycerol-1-phosphate dehydrogenase [NAD(P)+]
VSVGSGVINDLGKWLAFEAELPFVSFATAASMNGYASANVAPCVRGVKTLLRARPPRAVLTCPRVLAEAPYALTTAGLGDVLAKLVSSADWFLNHMLFGDYYCRLSVDLVRDLEPVYLGRSVELATGSAEVIEAVFSALLLTGAAMTMAESSAPASGAEHLVSHSLDMLAVRDGRAHDLHGRQVGLGTILSAELYRRVLAVDVPRPRPLAARVDRAYWGPLSSAVAAQYAMKQGRLHEAARKLLDRARWEALRQELASMVRPPELIRDCLAAAGGAVRAADVGCGQDRIRAVLIHAHQMRSRFTVLDLAHLLGILPDQADELVTTWA